MMPTHTSQRAVKAGLAAVLGLAVALPLSSALAGGTKPTPQKPGGPPAKPPVAAQTEPAASSYVDLVNAYEKKEKDAVQDLKRQRYEAVLAYVKAKPDAPDLEDAREALVDLAETLEDWPAVVKHADEFVAAHAASEKKDGILVQKADALAALDKFAEGKAIYADLTKEVKSNQGGINLLIRYASFLAEGDDVQGARDAYAKLKDLVPEHAQEVDQLAKGLDDIGADPTPFPETAKDMDGKVIKLSDYKGKVVLIDFWATWCPPCRAEMPNVVAAYKKFHDKGFEVIGISLDEKGKEKEIHEFALKTGMSWRQFYDGKHFQNEIAELYQVTGIPHTVLVGKDGKIVRTGLRGETLQRRLAKLLK